MWAEERKQKIIEVLTKDSRVTTDALIDRFNVSRETIRRDLKDLETTGLLRRTHGGALSISPAGEMPFPVREAARTREKRAIGEAASTLISPGECCFIDAGSTTASFASVLGAIPDISVITNSVQVAMAVRSARRNAEIVLLGGVLGDEVPGTFGAVTLAQLSSLRADVAFVSPVGIAPEEGVTYYDIAESEVAKMMLANARRKVILADSSKCGLTSRVVVCSCRDVDVLVSDIEDPAPFQAAGIASVLSIHSN